MRGRLTTALKEGRGLSTQCEELRLGAGHYAECNREGRAGKELPEVTTKLVD
jgi:hypothetical protein